MQLQHKLQTARTINGVSLTERLIFRCHRQIWLPGISTGWLETGDNGASITTEQLVTLLRDNVLLMQSMDSALCLGV